MHYVFTDIHGDLKSWQTLLNSPYSAKENTLIFLGDACDRGENGYEIMKQMLKTPNLIYLKGNHEDMFVEAAREIIKFKKQEKLSLKEIQRLQIFELDPGNDFIFQAYSNGGTPTLKAWIRDGMKKDILAKLDNLPCCYSWDKFDMCHAGVPIFIWNEIAHNSREFKEECLWNRDHFVGSGEWFEDRVLIHGHTPTTSGLFTSNVWVNRDRKPIPIRYADCSKINLDTHSYKQNHFWVYCLETEKFERIDK